MNPEKLLGPCLSRDCRCVLSDYKMPIGNYSSKLARQKANKKVVMEVVSAKDLVLNIRLVFYSIAEVGIDLRRSFGATPLLKQGCLELVVCPDGFLRSSQREAPQPLWVNYARAWSSPQWNYSGHKNMKLDPYLEMTIVMLSQHKNEPERVEMIAWEKEHSN